MKNAINNTLIKLPFLLLLMFALFSSCQDEIVDVTDPSETETIVADSPLANFIQRTSTFDGSFDNIIDLASCIGIELPVTVIVNGLEITIDSEEDLDIIEAIFDEFSDDDDELEIIFPITIILSDHSEVIINSYEELEEFTAECSDDDVDDDDIECIDFQYPITISIFNSDFDVIDTVTINSDEALYEFIDDLDGGVLASINFPVTMILADGSEIEVNNNEELQAAIEAAEDACDEDDDSDYDDDDTNDIPIEDLENLLVNCTWKVDELEIDDVDLEDQYVGFVFDFNADGTVVATGPGGETYEGTWELYETDSGIKLNLQMNTLTDFNNEMWLLYEIEDEYDGFEVEFRQGIDELSFKKYECEDDVADCTEEQIDAYLMECAWAAGFSGGDALADYRFYFEDTQNLVVHNLITDEEIVGAWETSMADGYVIITISQFEGDFSDLNGEWKVIECEEDRIKVVSADGDDPFIVFERDCDDDSTPDDLANIVVEGTWIVALYNDSGTDETSDYADYEFVFNTDGSVVASDGTATVAGTWSGFISDGQLQMALNFGTDAPLNEFNDEDWDVFSLEPARLELHDVSGGDGSLDKLVFEKL